MGNRKQHSGDAGYIAERKNHVIGGSKVVIYVAAEQGIDVDEKYAVVCDAHGSICEASSVPKARILMKAPDEFCHDCRCINTDECRACGKIEDGNGAAGGLCSECVEYAGEYAC